MPTLAQELSRMYGVGVLVDDRDAVDVGGLVRGEGDGDAVPGVEVDVPAEVGQALVLLLAHVLVVGLAGGVDARSTSRPMPTGCFAASMIPSRMSLWSPIASLVSSTSSSSCRRSAQRQQLRVEELSSACACTSSIADSRVHSVAERRGVGPVDLVEHGEHPPLLVVVAENQLGDVHGGHLPPAAVQA